MRRGSWRVAASFLVIPLMHCGGSGSDNASPSVPEGGVLPGAPEGGGPPSVPDGGGPPPDGSDSFRDDYLANVGTWSVLAASSTPKMNCPALDESKPQNQVGNVFFTWMSGPAKTNYYACVNHPFGFEFLGSKKDATDTLLASLFTFERKPGNPSAIYGHVFIRTRMAASGMRVGVECSSSGADFSTVRLKGLDSSSETSIEDFLPYQQGTEAICAEPGGAQRPRVYITDWDKKLVRLTFASDETRTTTLRPLP